MFPTTRGTIFQQEHERALREPRSVAFEAVSVLTGRWLEVRAYPAPQGLAVYFRDISERKQADELLREADHRKNEFLAILAHELRNPLAPLRNAVHILRRRFEADPTVAPMISMTDRQMTHLVRLVDDLLDVSRITSGKLTLRRRNVLLTQILNSAVEASRAFVEARRHELVVALRALDSIVDADPDRLA